MVALSFIAGRKVATVIRDADFFHFTTGITEGVNVGQMLAEQSMYPMARSKLLDPHAQSIAIGVQKSDSGDAMAFVISTYEHPDPEAHAETEASLYDALNEVRGRRALPRVERFGDRGTNALMDKTMGGLEIGFPPSYQADQFEKKFAKLHHRAFGFAYLGLAHDGAEALEWPPQLLQLEAVRVSMRVGYYRPNGTNWGHELVVIAYM
jgi:hypothetical protein